MDATATETIRQKLRWMKMAANSGTAPPIAKQISDDIAACQGFTKSSISVPSCVLHSCRHTRLHEDPHIVRRLRPSCRYADCTHAICLLTVFAMASHHVEPQLISRFLLARCMIICEDARLAAQRNTLKRTAYHTVQASTGLFSAPTTA